MSPSRTSIDPQVQDEHARKVLQRQIDGLPASSPATNSSSASARTVFAYATPFDVLLIAASTLSAIIAGALNPLLTVIYGLFVRSFQDHADGRDTGAALSSNVSEFTLYYVYLGIAEFVFIYIATVGFYHSGERITRNLRRAYLKATIRQNIAFFDSLNAGQATTHITSDMNVIQEGISSKIALCLTALATFISAVVISFIMYWKLALILISTAVLLAGAESVGGIFAVKYSKQSSAALSKGSAVAEEVISSIRHVNAFGIQKVMSQRYGAHLATAEKWGVKTRLAIAVMIGTINAVPYLSYGLAFWQGSRYVVSGEMSASSVVTTTMASIIGAFAVGRVAPSAESFIHSIAHAGVILKAIARRSPLDLFDTEGKQLASVLGDLELQNVSLVYPSRQTVEVLNRVNLQFPANKVTALVGASGCGKSSIIGLLERFYEPTGGVITLDGHQINDLNLNWLRQQMSYVNQEPLLFNRSIFANILLGLKDPAGPGSEKEAQKLVYNAARIANAHDLITALPQGYQTEVGAKGLQLSGGQRQRICIARAVISNPKILLLDEATSALDVRSERAVQLGLDLAAKDRTTIVIAHRLSTVRNADRIIVMSHGSVLERGSHDDLISQKGVYARLIETQQLGGVPEEEKNTILEEENMDVAILDEKADIVYVNEHHPERREVVAAETHTRPTFKTYLQVVGRLNRDEAPVIIAGLALCILAGFVIPAQSVFFAEAITAVSLPASHYPKLRDDVNFWCLIFLMIAIVAFIAWVGQGICFSYSTERLVHKARAESFRSILRQSVAFFDTKDHSSGALTSFLATAPTDLTGLSGAIIGAILTFVATIAAGIVLSLAIGWKLALVCTATIPVVTGCGYIRLRMLALFDSKVRKTHEEAAMYANEIVTAIRSVAALTLEAHVLEEYSVILATQAARSLRSILKASTLYAASQSFTFFGAALAFWFGGRLVSSDEYSMLQFYICFAALISGAQVAGAVFSYAPDMSKALHAGADLKTLFDLVPAIDTWNDSTSGSGTESSGRIEIVYASFRYPTRPERLVLDRFSVSIQPGQYVALVGASGSGKSTVIQLLVRFFDPTEGKIFVDGQDISQVNVNEYRRLVSLVSQEPTLYEGSIRDNLVLGTERDVSGEEIVQACKEANIYEFITSLPDGFATTVGTSGTLLSGGQKQRLSIARALLRKTKILLLDEATSALDSESERVVQEALDRVEKQRTTIAVAHRLSTIQHADLICVLDQGQVVERGTHAQLMGKRGAYHDLVQMQSLEQRRT
ncbi:hypothetical protein ASPVEDRAFT_141498 [Aspergillus versicolor CBS 583.65]|uniref:ABC transporter n=1 Tax=Aspergillus versicolor CBS 583.65 TaxID=1036611 RepID=A0A1L9Q0A4_ASPVE|nr:uncharacterized protein ASPVEDRAFT_141498 [Aspergillus versicolor CBS 583.65]OJJ07136.1 hypothetical protein ASPVEDRAFT_141498 [Aspergillus versicolor CBS 583.65]